MTIVPTDRPKNRMCDVKSGISVPAELGVGGSNGRCYVNGCEVTSFCFFASERLGIARCAKPDAENQKYRSGDGVASVEFKGVVSLEFLGDGKVEDDVCANNVRALMESGLGESLRTDAHELDGNGAYGE